MHITSVVSTELFVGDPADPRQVIRVELDQPGPQWIEVTGDGVTGAGDLRAGQTVAEIGVRHQAPPGHRRSITVRAGDATATGELVAAEPGWTVWMVSHFHYDPVWWTTQAAYTATWGAPGTLGAQFRADFQQAGFELVRLHLETARLDPDYKFVLAELDYLKPYWDSHPQDRAYLRRLLADRRLELMGGTYNEPNTNLTSAESTIRNLVYGAGFQRDIMGGDPRTAWQLDVFGHDPQFPGLVAAAGLDSSSWARGPFHQWGPMLSTHQVSPGGWGDPSGMQFSSEFEWLSPSGSGVLTHYMPAHYSAGWRIDGQATLAEAEASVYELFRLLKKVAATRNVLLPVGTDYTPPAKWVTDIHRDWNARYAWPRFVCGLPREFFDAVRGQLAREGRRLSGQTRDMNPLYTGKDVSFIDTKQVQRQVETVLGDAEIFATIAAGHGAAYPHAAVDQAWRQLAFGAHHDGITGSESDQVYLDLMTGWREAYDLAHRVLDAALAHLAPSDVDSGPTRPVTVFNPSAWARTDLVTVRVPFPHPGTRGVVVRDGERACPVLLEHPERHDDGSLAAVDVTFLATAVPSVGYRTWELSGTAADSPIGWSPAPATGAPTIGNATYRLAVDPGRGGCVSTVEDRRTGRRVLAPGQVGNELLVYEEYPAHPRYHEGPWHLLPKGGPVAGSARSPAESVQVQTGPLGERIIVTGRVGPARYRQELTLWTGLDRIDARTHLDEFTGSDELLRLRWPVAVPGALPVSETAHAVVGRGFGLIDVDSDQAPWTLDNPAHNWFALSATARVEVSDVDGTASHRRALGIAEVIAPASDQAARALTVALAGQGVTATASTDTGPRYGRLALDSNLPDFRISLGGPADNAFTADLLDQVDPGYGAELRRQLATSGQARLWVPAATPLTEVWVPNADLTGTRALPVLVVVGDPAELARQVATGLIPVRQPATLGPFGDPDLDRYTVGLVNRGTPGFAVDPGGALHLSLLRSCTGWPSGVWIDPPRRTAPDGSTFQQQHWTHTFEYALVAGPGDWREAELVRHGQEVNHPLRARLGGPGGARSFVTVQPAGQVLLSALKPTGNPLARGGVPDERVDRVTVRVYEAAGRPAPARVELWTRPTEVSTVDLIERVTTPGGDLTADLGPAAIHQWSVGLPPPPTPAPVAPVDQPPVYTRYWLHNNGPAPTGNLPVAVHVEPAYAPADGPVTLTVTVASDLTAVPAEGRLELLVPDGWQCAPSTVDYRLDPGGYLAQPVTVTPPADGPPGVYWARARTVHCGQTLEDVARLLVGSAVPERIEAAVSHPAVRLYPGQESTVELRLSSDAATAITVQVHLIGPGPTWDLFPTAQSTVEVPAGRTATLGLPVRVPPGHRPGRWWALLRLGHAGQLHYTEPITIEVLQRDVTGESDGAGG